ncbi:MAG: fused MFS/spermidine synthase [Burkholderiales bacterium]
MGVRRDNKAVLLLSVALAGMAVLIVEIAATRMLAPFFGNSIYTLSSVIGCVLAALGLGYYAGGALADRRPSARWFFAVIALGGFAVLLLQLLNAVLLPAVGYRLSLVHGPLVVSALMFFLPAFFLAMLSPFAIALLHARAAGGGVGNASGQVFFWSTLGSIVGSLGTGFVLIPKFGIGSILLGVGAGLVLLGSAGLALARARPRVVPLALALAGIASGGALWQLAVPQLNGAVYAADGVYDRIVIRDIAYRGRVARVLWQDLGVSGGQFLDDGRMAFDYTKYYELYRLFTPELKTALAIGGGAYTVPRAILRKSPHAVVDVAEIDPVLHRLAVRYFALPDDARLRNHVLDGRRFLHDAAGGYDLIFADAYHSLISAPPQFATREFFELAQRRLADNGVLISNYYGSLAADSRASIYAELRTLRSVFPQVYAIATTDAASDELQNFILIGHKAVPASRRIDLRRAADIDFDDPLLKTVADRELRPSDAELAAYPVLTDDYAPLEYYAAAAIRRYDALARGR